MTQIENVKIIKSEIEESKIIVEGGGTIDVKDMETITNKSSSIDTTSTMLYPTTKAVADYVRDKISTAEIYRPKGSINKTQFEQLINKQSPYGPEADVRVGYVYNMSEPVQYPLSGEKQEWYPTGTNFVVIDNDATPRVLDALAGNTSNFLTKLGKEPYSGQEYHFPYNINALTQEAGKIKTTFDTISLDDHTVKVTYPIEIPSADIDGDKAGLYTKALADNKSKVIASASEVEGATMAKSLKIDGTDYNVGVDLAEVSNAEIDAMWS